MSDESKDPNTTASQTKGPVQREMELRLEQALHPTLLAVQNDSAMHSGHIGDDGSGESHFTVTIESPLFVGQSRVAMQRLVNDALANLLKSGEIHALAIQARAPVAHTDI